MKPSEYLQEFEKLVVESRIITTSQIKERVEKRFEAYIKIRLMLTDGSVLDVTEYIHAAEEDDAQVKRYSYHWMDSANQLRIRWDNVRHFPTCPVSRTTGTTAMNKTSYPANRRACSRCSI